MMRENANQKINSVCETLGIALNELSDIRKKYNADILALESLVNRALGMMKSKYVQISDKDIETVWVGFIKDAEETLKRRQ